MASPRVVQLQQIKEELAMSEIKCSVTPLGEETKQYDCGHSGPSRYNFLLGGTHTIGIDPSRVDPCKCGQCHLDELEPQLIPCEKCHIPILPGDSCVMNREGKIFCGSIDCGHTPLNTDPGIWDGKTFESDFITGRGMTTFPRG